MTLLLWRDELEIVTNLNFKVDVHLYIETAYPRFLAPSSIRSEAGYRVLISVKALRA